MPQPVTRRSLLLAALASGAWGALPSRAQQPFAHVMRSTFADLLRTPLAPPSVDVQTHDRREEDGLVVEDLSWKTLDDETVPAFVVSPKGDGPFPAVVCLHGSSGSRDSMMTESFGPGEWTKSGADQPHTRMLGWARELARRGYLALAMTQRGLDTRTPFINTLANTLLIEGRTAMAAVLYEIRQAVTYLEARPDVGKIGASGMSFGGITSFYVWLLDERVDAAAPICGGVGSLRTFVDEGSLSYHGTYWWVPGMLEKGDHADFASALAGHPLMVWAPRSDVGMPKPGVDKFRSALEPAYAAVGKSAALEIHQSEGVHSFTVPAFEAMETFFGKYLRA